MSDNLRKTQPWPEVEEVIRDPYSFLNWCHFHWNKKPCVDCEDEHDKRDDEEESEALARARDAERYP